MTVSRRTHWGTFNSGNLRSEHKKGRLLRQYLVLSLFLVSGGLIISSIIQVYFSYRDAETANIRLQQEITGAAAFRIGEFIAGVEQWLRAAGTSKDVALRGVSSDFKFELE